MKTVLITGGAGFIGSHLCEEFLKKGFKVICADNLITGQKNNIIHLLGNKNFKFILADVSELSSYKGPVKNYKLDYILHFASPAGPNPYSSLSYMQIPIETYLVNSLGTHLLLNLAKKNKAEFLFASSSEIYGNPLEHPQKETYFGNVNPIGPRACYDISKRFGEMATMTFAKKFGIKVKIIRIFNTYGPRMNPKDGRSITLFITQALKNKPLTIFGNGQQTRSFCYIDDLVEGVTKVIEKGGTGEVYNLGSPQEITINKTVKKILSLTKSSSKIIYQKSCQDDPERRCPDITKAQKYLSWQPKISFEQGLLKTIEYFSNGLKS